MCKRRARWLLERLTHPRKPRDISHHHLESLLFRFINSCIMLRSGSISSTGGHLSTCGRKFSSLWSLLCKPSRDHFIRWFIHWSSFTGFTFYKADTSIQGMQNTMFAIFMQAAIFPPLVNQEKSPFMTLITKFSNSCPRLCPNSSPTASFMKSASARPKHTLGQPSSSHRYSPRSPTKSSWASSSSASGTTLSLAFSLHSGKVLSFSSSCNSSSGPARSHTWLCQHCQTPKPPRC